MLALLYVAGVPLGAVLGLAWLGRTELRSGWAGVRRGFAALWALVATRTGRRLAVGLAGVLAVAMLQAKLDPDVTLTIGRDWTPLVRALEGDFPARVQRATPEFALVFLGIVYLVGLPLCIALPLLWWGAGPQARATASLTLTLLANYLLALPFYVFAPVSEPAWSGLSEALPGLELIAPGLTPDLRVASALDNCFPSLHVSIAFGAYWVTRRNGPRRLSRLMLVHLALVVWAVLALGVHWLTDAVFGALFGLVCALAAERAVFAYEDEAASARS